MSEQYNKVPELSAEKANKLYNEDGLSYAQIAEKFSSDSESISHTTVRNRVEDYKKGKEDGKSEVLNNPQEYDLKEVIKDEPPENNPFDTVICPACGEHTEKPKNPGKKACDSCGTVLNWKEDEL